MLDEYRSLYKTAADSIPEWGQMTRSELCFAYAASNDDYERQCYIGAIMCKFWSMMTKSYYKQQVRIANEGDCYNWLVTAVLYVLEYKPWEDAKSSLYNDPLAPEKAINTCFKNEMLNFFVAANRHKRKLSYSSYSLDSVVEDSAGNEHLMEVADEETTPIDEIDSKLSWSLVVQRYFKAKDYFSAFTIDAFLRLNFNLTKSGIEDSAIRKQLSKHLSEISDAYCENFAKTYALDVNAVLRSRKYVCDLSMNKLTRDLHRLKSDMEQYNV